MNAPNIPPNITAYISILESKINSLEIQIKNLGPNRINREYKIGPWRQFWLGSEVPGEFDKPIFLVFHGETKESFIVRSAKIADVLQATLNLMELEDAQVQSQVNDNSTEGAPSGELRPVAGGELGSSVQS